MDILSSKGTGSERVNDNMNDNMNDNLNDNQKQVIEAYIWIRKHNQSIPDHILKTMKTAAISELKTSPAERLEPNTKRLPDIIISDIRKSLGVEPDDTSKDNIINTMDNDELFDKWCRWQGLINWSGRIRATIQVIYNLRCATI